jgi:excinuclease UvrABC nuclease subunit
MGQLLLIADPRPLDERLGRKFFRNAPKRPGVYLMRDAADNVLYVGKAKNLQQRLRNYRIANPDRMPRRHLRMLRQVSRIELQFCPGELAALTHESKLLRALKPRFNRAGVWPGQTRFLAWRLVGEVLEMAVVDVPETGWQRFGPLGGAARHLHVTLARLIWLSVNPDRSYVAMPAGWAHGKLRGTVAIHCGDLANQARTALDSFFWNSPAEFLSWLEVLFAARTQRFERAVIDSEIETLQQFSIKNSTDEKNKRQFALL